MNKKNVILSITIFLSMLVLGGIGYFGFQYYQEKQEENMKLFMEKKNKECYDLISPLETQKIKRSEGEGILGQFYSKKLGSCLYYGSITNYNENNPNATNLYVSIVLKDLLTNNVIEKQVLCDGLEACQKVMTENSGSTNDALLKQGKSFMDLVDSYR